MMNMSYPHVLTIIILMQCPQQSLLPIHPHRLTHPQKPTKKRNLSTYMSEFNQTIDALIIGERIMDTTIS